MLIHARAVQQHPLAQSRGSFQQQMRRLRKCISSFQGKVDELVHCAKQASTSIVQEYQSPGSRLAGFLGQQGFETMLYWATINGLDTVPAILLQWQ